jgi:hypothetical protein
MFEHGAATKSHSALLYYSLVRNCVIVFRAFFEEQQNWEKIQTDTVSIVKFTLGGGT